MSGHTLCVGTVGSGVWYSSDGGERWRQARMNHAFDAQPGEIQVRALASAPGDPSRLYAGSEVGLYRSDDGGDHWEPAKDSPMAGDQIWSVAVHPDDPDTVLVGTKPPALYRSVDGGASFEKLALETARECFAGAPKITSIVFDPRDSARIWVSVEIDGVYRSDDGGETWEHLPPRGDNPINEDVHCLAVAPGAPAKVLAATPDGIWTSTDEGQTWDLHAFPKFYENRGISYCRGVALQPGNPEVIFVGNGNTVPGHVGAIQRSTDGGKSWKPASVSATPNSTIYWFATHPADPDYIVANSLYGYVYVSRDGGESFEKLEREFGEIRALAWVPN